MGFYNEIKKIGIIILYAMIFCIVANIPALIVCIFFGLKNFIVMLIIDIIMGFLIGWFVYLLYKDEFV